MVDQILNTVCLPSSVVKQDLMFEMTSIVNSLLAERLFLIHESFWLTVPERFGITLFSTGGVSLGQCFKRYGVCCADKLIVC